MKRPTWKKANPSQIFPFFPTWCWFFFKEELEGQKKKKKRTLQKCVIKRVNHNDEDDSKRKEKCHENAMFIQYVRRIIISSTNQILGEVFLIPSLIFVRSVHLRKSNSNRYCWPKHSTFQIFFLISDCFCLSMTQSVFYCLFHFSLSHPHT